MARERVKECISRLETLLRVWHEEKEIIAAFVNSIKNEFSD